MELIRKPVSFFILVLGLSGASLSQAANISITHKSIDAGAMVAQDATGTLTLVNKDKIPVTLTTVDSDAATRTEIHRHPINDGDILQSEAQLKQGVILQPGKPVTFDGEHLQIVFRGLKKNLEKGDKVDLTLHFSDGDAIGVKLPVHERKAVNDKHTIRLSHARARATHSGMSSSAAYMDIENHGKKDVRLVSVKSPVAKKTELHTTLMKDGVMKMQEVENLRIPAGDKVRLQPGGLHVMLMGLNGQIKEGDKVPVTMAFSNGQTVSVEAMATTEVKGHGMAH